MNHKFDTPGLNIPHMGRVRRPRSMRTKISHVRGGLYKTARFLGDVQAVLGGPKAIGKRIGRRIVGRALGRYVMRNLFK